MIENIDLHIHATASDGCMAPQDIVDAALKKFLKVISITDHDTVEGVEKAIDYNKNNNRLEVVPGIEFSLQHIQSLKVSLTLY